MYFLDYFFENGQRLFCFVDFKNMKIRITNNMILAYNNETKSVGGYRLYILLKRLLF